MSDSYPQQLVKLIKLLGYLSRHTGASVDEIKELLECSERTVYRWINTLSDLHFKIEKHETINGIRYKIPRDSIQALDKVKIPYLGLDVKDIQLLHLILSQERIFYDTSYKKIIDSLLARLTMVLSDEEREFTKRLESLVIPNLKPRKSYSDKEYIIESLTQAILTRRCCDVLYYILSKKKKYQFTINPLHFFESKGGLYVMVQLHDMVEKGSYELKETIRTLAVERIERIIINNETFDYPENLDPTELLSQAFDIVWDDPIKVKIHFSPEEAPYVIERTWPGKYSWEWQEDGSIIFDLETSGYDDVKRWILSFGDGAEVLEPEELREDIAETCREMARKYRKQLPVIKRGKSTSSKRPKK